MGEIKTAHTDIKPVLLSVAKVGGHVVLEHPKQERPVAGNASTPEEPAKPMDPAKPQQVSEPEQPVGPQKSVEPTVSATSFPANLLRPPIVLSRKCTVELYKKGIKLRIRKSYFSAETVTPLVPWSNLSTCDLEYSCFYGTLTFKREGDSSGSRGKPIKLTGRLYKLREVAKVAYEQMHTPKETSLVDPKVSKKLGWWPKAVLLDHGVVLNKRTGWFKGQNCFVPWGQAQTVEMYKGYIWSAVKIRTMVASADISDLLKSVGSNPGVPPGSSEQVTTAQLGASSRSHFHSVTIRGRNRNMRMVFDQIVHCMCVGEKHIPVEDAPKLSRTQLTNLGIHTATWLKRVTTFMPWNAVTTMEFVHAPRSLVKGTVHFTDRVGTKMAIRSVHYSDYDKLHAIYARHTNAVHERSIEGAPEPIVRRHLRIAWDGISVPTRHLLPVPRYDYVFYPWKEVDAAEMDVDCFGGHLYLITEGMKTKAHSKDAVRIPVWNAYTSFGISAMRETLLKIREMKFHGKSEQDTKNHIWFAGKKDSNSSCLLTDVSLRVVVRTNLWLCQYRTCIIDLDSVYGCSVLTQRCCCGFGTRSYLAVTIDKAMGQVMDVDDDLQRANAKVAKAQMKDQTLLVRLRRRDKANKIKNEIIDRAKIRSKMEDAHGPHQAKPSAGAVPARKPIPVRK